jgi:hypothetical protein
MHVNTNVRHSLANNILDLGEALETKCPDHQLIKYLALFRGKHADTELTAEYGRRFTNGIGSTFMDADLNYCKALHEALRE